jgi:hypothetical protein
MAEDEIAVVRVVGALAQLTEGDRDTFGHRHRPARSGGLRITVRLPWARPPAQLMLLASQCGCPAAVPVSI